MHTDTDRLMARPAGMATVEAMEVADLNLPANLA